MSGATAHTDPHDNAPAPPAGRLSAAAITLLSLVRALVVVGQALIDGAGRLGRDDLLTRFSTLDITLIVARVRRGLMIAARLEQRLVRHGHRLGISWPATRRVAVPRPQDDQPKPPRFRAEPFDAAADDSALLAGLPTAEDIARRMRRQSIGAVLADLCLDFGIDTKHPLWRDLQIAIIDHGGNLVPVLDAWLQRGANRWKIALREIQEHASPEDASPEEALPEQASARSVAWIPDLPLPLPAPAPSAVAPRPAILATPPPALQAA